MKYFFMKSVLIIIIVSLCIGVKAEHPLHLSVVNMNIEEGAMKINYSVRLFQEDLITLLGMLNHEALHKNQVLDSNAVHKYICEAFKIYTDQKQVSPILSYKKNNELEYWLYYEVTLNDIPTEIIIQNKIFLELFLDQQNLLIFSYRNKENGITFDRENQKQTIFLDSI